MIDFSKKLSDFSGIDLEQLNASASFLDRIDTKFLLTQNDLSFFIISIKKKLIQE